MKLTKPWLTVKADTRPAEEKLREIMKAEAAQAEADKDRPEPEFCELCQNTFQVADIGKGIGYKPCPNH